MATKLSTDPELINEALKLSGKRTKKAAVTKALRRDHCKIFGVGVARTRSGRSH